MIVGEADSAQGIRAFRMRHVVLPAISLEKK